MAATIRTFAGKRPELGRGVFLAETCSVIGDVVIGEESSIWYGTVVRGDVMPIRIGARTSIQDNTVIHVTSDFSGTIIGDDCTVGHAAIIHACTVEDFCLIGMGSYTPCAILAWIHQNTRPKWNSMDRKPQLKMLN